MFTGLALRPFYEMMLAMTESLTRNAVSWIKTTANRYAANLIFGITIKSIIFILAVTGAWSAGLPLAAIAFYSASNGLPLFEIISALGDNANKFLGLSALTTAALSAIILAPGFVKLTDPGNLPPSPSTLLSTDEIRKIESNRWSWSFIPGLIIASSALLFLEHPQSNESLFLYSCAAPPFIICIKSIIFDMHCNTPSAEKITDPILRAKITQWHPSHLLATNGIGALYFLIYVILCSQIIHQHANYFEIGQIEGKYLIVALGIASGILATGTYTLASSWGQRPTLLRIFAAVSGGMALMLIAWPNGSRLMSAYLRLFSEGGGAPVILTTDSDLCREWPELFLNCDGSQRTKALKMELLGSNTIFIRLPRGTAETNIKEGSVLIIDRSRVTGIAFLNAK